MEKENLDRHTGSRAWNKETRRCIEDPDSNILVWKATWELLDVVDFSDLIKAIWDPSTKIACALCLEGLSKKQSLAQNGGFLPQNVVGREGCSKECYYPDQKLLSEHEDR